MATIQMKPIIRELAVQIQNAFQSNDTALDASKRIPSAVIFAALESIKPLIERDYGKGHPVTFRYAGYEKKCPMQFDVLEYLVDFSFSRYMIPEAIAQLPATRIQDGTFELIFIAESELGTMDEVCRDLLKLLDVRSEIRCLLFHRLTQNAAIARLQERLLYVLHHHAHFGDTRHGWLFIGLDVEAGTVRCYPSTLTDDSTGFVPIT
jgi:hypothetical protein